MKKIIYSAIIIAIIGCGGHSHDHVAEQHVHNHIHSFTAYTHNAEFFMQHEGLNKSEKSCITLYVTNLKDFKPSVYAEAEATLSVGSNSQTVTAKAGHKGVFHFDFSPKHAGEGVLRFNIGNEQAHFHVDIHEAHNECSGHNHSHTHEGEHAHADAHNHKGDHTHSHDHEHSIAHHHNNASHPGLGVTTEGKPGDVSFSKEQSWKIDFATAIATKSNFDGVVKVVAKVDAAPETFTTVIATTSGKVKFAGNLVEGKNVCTDEQLFYLEGSDVTDNDAAVKYAEAESEYHVAKADYERKKNLFIEKIVSEREYQAAEATYRTAEARFESMQRNFGEGKVSLRSPINGYIADILVENGDYVEPGTPLAIVQFDGNINITAELPVRYASQLKNIKEVVVETPQSDTYTFDELDGYKLFVGSSVNSCNMIPVTIATTSLDGVVPGSTVTLYMTSRTAREDAVVVPRSAIVEEMGSNFVFVQNNPVSFEKRSVVTGTTDGRYVKIHSGVHAGERVVTKGAVILKLSQGVAALDPHAGHVH